jgi:hypothetical protein
MSSAVFEVTPADAGEPEVSAARASQLAGQFIFDEETHFVKDDYDVKDILFLAKYADAQWNPGRLKDSYGLSLDITRYVGGASTDLVPDLQHPDNPVPLLTDQIERLHIGGTGG